MHSIQPESSSVLARHASWLRWSSLLVVITASAFVAQQLAIHLPLRGISWPNICSLVDNDKLAHCASYGTVTALLLLTISVRRGWRAVWSHWRGRSLVGAALLAMVCLGMVDEFTQPWTGRTFDWFDLVADAIGIATAGVAMVAIAWWRLRRDQQAAGNRIAAAHYLPIQNRLKTRSSTSSV